MFSYLIKIIVELLKILFILVFPFILLIRGAVEFHEQFRLGPALSIIAGVGITAILLFLYFTVFYSQFTGSIGNGASIKRRAMWALAITFLYAVHGIFYLSSSNLKNDEVRNEINKTHPILRLSVSTIVYLDKDLIITDGSRVPEDYTRMGLKKKSHSLHYRQSNGYAHALDLRTNNRSVIRNFLIRNYFRLMGFRTLRHVGTDDHLHISLMSHDRPNGL